MTEHALESGAFLRLLMSHGVGPDTLSELRDIDIAVLAEQIKRLAAGQKWDPLDPALTVLLNDGRRYPFKEAFAQPVSQLFDDPKIIRRFVEMGFGTLGRVLALGDRGLAQLPGFGDKKVDYADASLRAVGLGVPVVPKDAAVWYRWPIQSRLLCVYDDLAAVGLEFAQLRFVSGQSYLDVCMLQGLHSFHDVLDTSQNDLHDQVFSATVVQPVVQLPCKDAIANEFTRRLTSMALFFDKFQSL